VSLNKIANRVGTVERRKFAPPKKKKKNLEELEAQQKANEKMDLGQKEHKDNNV